MALTLANLWWHISDQLNFFRVHLLFFTFSPLFFSAIFYAANGQFHISYIDSLYNCVSAATVCGLATVDLSSLTGFQQALLLIQSSLGNPVIVSWTMVYIRRRYFAKRFENIIEAEMARRRENAEREGRDDSSRQSIGRRLSLAFGVGDHLPPVSEGSSEEHSMQEREKEGRRKRFGIFTRKTLQKLRPEMIRRMDDAPKPVGPNGWISEEPVIARPHRPRSATVTVAEIQEKDANNGSLPPRLITVTDSEASTSHPTNHPNAPGSPILTRTQTLPRTPTIQNARTSVPLGHTFTVEFVTPERDLRGRGISHERRPSVIANTASQRSRSPAGSRRHSTAGEVVHDDRDYVPPGAVPLNRRHTTQYSHRSIRDSTHDRRSTKNKGYGGFPYPTVLLLRLFRLLFPNLERKLVRTMTMRDTQTISTYPDTTDRTPKHVPYVSFEAVIGRNSKFHLLTEENLEELGGVEYRALTALLWIVACYHFGLQILTFIIIAPYMSMSRWRSDFLPPNLHRYIPPTWFSAFQVVSAYTNTGMSLVDQSMIPFQTAYPLIFAMCLLILAGNTAYPVFLRFTIWCITKCIPIKSRLNVTLHFLLDHPRRCFIYLFPSHQTWFLLTVVILLTATDWFFFLVLDIGNAAMESIPIGVRFAIGLLQACAVRSAGFATVALGSLAPAVQTLFVMMMYISVYPIAMSVRSTNVYEEKSLGVFDDDDEEEDDDDEERGGERGRKRADREPSLSGPRSAVWGRYLAWHARRQLAFDMWWIGLALFLLCIIERGKIQDEENFQWFTIFTIIFELISAYGTVGLSLGVPYANFSFSGALSPLSKLIIIAVMIRGRHRGLPVAIDRAVMLPVEFKKATSGGAQDEADVPMNEPLAEDHKPERILEEAEPESSESSNQEKPIVESPVPASPESTPRPSHESQLSQTLPKPQ